MTVAKIFIALMFSTQALAAANNCVVVIIGGIMHRDPSSPAWSQAQDLASKVQHAAIAQARRTGCRVEDLSELKPDQFLARLRSLAPAGQRPNIHLSFTDHGVPASSPAEDTFLPTGESQAGMEGVALREIFSTLSRSLPANSRVTFQSSTCWPAFSEAALAERFDERMDFCGSSSTQIEGMSRNVTMGTEAGFRRVNGQAQAAYPIVGLLEAANRRAQGRAAPSVYASHVESRQGDIANILRNPGFTTSLVLARKVVAARTGVTMIPFNDPYGESYDATKLPEMMKGLNQLGIRPQPSAATLALRIAASMACMTCVKNQGLAGFSSFLVDVGNLTDFMVTPEPAWITRLPAPYKAFAQESFNYFKSNGSLLREFFNQRNIGSLPAKFLPLAAHLRTLQEASVVSRFLAVASPGEKARFNRIAGCENRPLL